MNKMINKILICLSMSGSVLLNANAQFTDKNISETITPYSGSSIVFDADNDGNDDFSISYNGTNTVSIDIFQNTGITAVGTFAANSTKAYFSACGAMIDYNLNVTWNTLIAPFNTQPVIDEQYGTTFNYSGAMINPTYIFRGGFIPIKINNHYGYILIDFDPAHNQFIVWMSRVHLQASQGLTVDCGTIGIDDVEAKNKFHVSPLSANKMLIENLANPEALSITDISGKQINFTSSLLQENNYEINIPFAPQEILLVCNRKTKQVMKVLLK